MEEAPPEWIRFHAEMQASLRVTMYALNVLPWEVGDTDSFVPYDALTDVLAYAPTKQLIYIVGGYDGSSHEYGYGQYFSVQMSSCEVYDTASGFSTRIKSMSKTRGDAGVCSVGGKIYVVGGTDGNSLLSSCEVYDTVSGLWTPIPSMSTERGDTGVCSIGDKIYVVGGQGLSNSLLSSCEMYDTVSGRWTPFKSMSTERNSAGVCSVGGNTYVMGGQNWRSCLSSCEMYDTVSGLWTPIKPMSTKRGSAGVCSVGDKIYVVGGSDGHLSFLSSCEMYDTVSGLWTPITPMPRKRGDAGVCSIGDRIYVVGGKDLSFLSSCEMYDTVSGLWTHIKSMSMRAGAGMLLLLFLLCGSAVAQTIPINDNTLTTRACQAPHDTYAFCNPSLSLSERVDDLIERIWATSSGAIPSLLTARNLGRSAMPALGVPEFDWGLNCIHGVQSSCISLPSGETKCPTSFMNPVNFGMAWNKTLARSMGAVLGVESRALWIAGAVEESPWSKRPHIGLDCWSPNINIARDPRWGRNQEVPSEDPLLNGDFGAQYTLGLQRGADPSYIQNVVTLKHWDAYSLENSDGYTRYDFNVIVSNYAMQTTYLPAFKEAVVGGGAKGVMCSYNAVNGIPTCAHPLLTTILRDTWGFEGYVTSDSGALENIHDAHHYTNSSVSTVSVALRDGQCDVCSGSVYNDSLMAALASGGIAREDIDLALTHTLSLRFQLGLFDAPERTPYWSVPPSEIATDASAALNLLATQESMVLLKNPKGSLPLPRGKKIAAIGPHANATMALVGNYLGQLCPDNKFDCIVSPFAALTSMNTGGTVTLTAGCDVTNNSTKGFAAAVAAANEADYVVLFLGIDLSVEGESNDRTSIDLPYVQHALAAAIKAVGKPIIVVLLHGGPVDICTEASDPAYGAIIDAGYPGFLGGTVIAQTLLGDNDRVGGKLAMTVYKADYVNQIKMSDMELDDGVGRGYRFFAGDVCMPFGFGLSMTTFTLSSNPPTNPSTLPTESVPTTVLRYNVTVCNTGSVTGDEVVQGYFAPRSVPSQPSSKLLKQLFSYERVHLAAGICTTLTFDVSTATLRMVDRASGDTVSTPGEFDILFTNGVDQTLTNHVTVVGTEVVISKFPF